MSKNADELVVASKGNIQVAPFGTELPDGTSAEDVTSDLDAAFVDLGYASEDGATLSVSPDIVDHMAWQARQAVRRDLNAQECQISTALEQWNGSTVPLAFGGGEITEPTTGVFRFDLPDEDDVLDERSLILDWADGDKHYRMVLPRGNVTEAVESNLVRNNLALLPITFKALAADDGGSPAYILSDDPAFAEPGS